MLLLSCVGLASAFDRVVVFGDSLSDAGNVFALSGGATPPAPYWNGRFSNGPVWVEGFASDLGRSASASLTGGTNYAFGGARLDPFQAVPPNIGTQIGLFQNASGTFGANDLVVFWAGSNDIFNGATNMTTLAGTANGYLQNLYGLGARNFLILNLVPLGFTPAHIGTANESLFNSRAQSFNGALAGHASSLRGLGANVTELDAYSAFLQIRSNPGQYGLTNVTQNYLTTGGNVNEFLFWDDVHPTQQIHQVLRQRAFAAVPEPGTMIVLGSVALVAAIRRRR